MNDLDNVQGAPFPPSRLTCHNDVRVYYSFCRTAPEDVLSSVTGLARPSVMLMGAGDARSIFYTLYRNFDPEFRGRFEGGTLLVNENWSVLLARDILLLHLCLQLPHKVECEEGKLLCAAIWAISFCCTLYPPHVSILKKALEALMKFSADPEAWASPENPLGQIVRFTTPDSFKDVTRHWERWSAEQPDNVPTKEEMIESRKSFLECLHKMPMMSVVRDYPEESLTHLMGLSADVIPRATQRKMQADFGSFLKTGAVFVENTLNLSEDEEWQTVPNITFFDGTRVAMKNNPFYGCVPFLGFFHTFVFSPTDCRSGNIARSIIERLPVTDEKFEEHPLVANCVQQLILWLSASSRALRKMTSQTKPDITFTFECCDPISLCLRMLRDPESYTTYLGVPPSFDIIHTFALVDAISPPDLILHCNALLKPDAFLFATTVRYRRVSYTLDRYMGSIFGVHPQIFAVMFGMRCLGVEATFSDHSLPRHASWKNHKKVDIRTLVFKRNVFSPFKIKGLYEIAFASDALLSCTHATTYSFPTNLYSNLMCTETVVSIFHSYIAQMDAETPVENYTFWESYVRQVREQVNLVPYHHHMQTTALLHGIHFHVTLTERDCPVCRYRPLSWYLAQFSVEIPNPNLTPHSTLAVFVTRGEVEIDNFLEYARDTHCVHAVALRRDKEERTYIDFFFPRSFSDAGYRLSIIKFAPTHAGGDKELFIPSMIYDGSLSFHITKGSRYFFRPLPPRQDSLITSFGSMRTNIAECENIRTIIDLSPELVYNVDWKSETVSSDQVTQMHLGLKSEHHRYDVHFPFPVLFPNMKIEFHCKLKTATITAPRDQHIFYEEAPLFVLTPTNRLFVPAVPVHPPASVVRDYLNLQLNSMEEQTLQRMPRSLITPVIKLKEMIQEFFKLVAQCRFVHIHTKAKGESESKLKGMLVIHDEIMDLDTASPGVDLSFCFLEEKKDQTCVSSAWSKITADCSARVLTVDADQLLYVKKMFGFYAERTHTVYTDNNRTTLCKIKVLRKHSVDTFFTRAVVLPLYACPDHQYEDRTVVREPEKTAPRYIAGVFTTDGRHISGDLKKVIESLSPQYFAERDKQQSSRGQASVNVTGSSDSETIANALVKLVEHAKSGNVVTIGGFPIRFKKEVYQRERVDVRKRVRGKETAKKSAPEKAPSATKPVKVSTREKAKTASAKMSSSQGKEEKSVIGERKEQKSSPAEKKKSDKVKSVSPERKKDENKEKEKHESVPTQPEAKVADVTSQQKITRGNDTTHLDETEGEILVDDLEDDTTLSKQRWNGRGGKSSHSSSSKGKCTNCGQSSDRMKKCAGCGKTRYCSRQCQKQHWKQHKPHCTATPTENGGKTMDGERESKGEKDKMVNGERENKEKTVREKEETVNGERKSKEKEKTMNGKEESGEKERGEEISRSSGKAGQTVGAKPSSVALLQCQTCLKTSENLKRCKCYAVSYCDVDCQRKDWPNHKKTCAIAKAKAA